MIKNFKKTIIPIVLLSILFMKTNIVFGEDYDGTITTNIEDSFNKIEFDIKTGEVEKDGVTTTLSKEFGIISNEDNLLNIDSLTKIVEESNYEIDMNGTTAIITNPYQTKTLIVKGTIDNNYGAIQEDYLNGYSVFKYSDEIETKNAFEKFKESNIEVICNEVLECEPNYLENEEIVLNGETTLNNSKSWGTTRMGLNYISSQINNLTSEQKKIIRVGIIDSGIDTTNKELNDRLVIYRDFIDTTFNGYDYLGHGTHVAGIVMDGTPDNVDIVSYKVFNSSGKTTTLALMYAINYSIYTDNVDVINMSLGSNVSAITQTFLDVFLYDAYKHNIPIACAAGNDYAYSYKNYPSNSAFTITVGSLPDGEGKFYSYGDGIDYVAAGVNVLSTFPTYLIYSATSQMVGTPYYNESGDMIGATYTMSGTSMATPHISAAIANILSLDDSYTISEVKSILNSFCEDLGNSGKDVYYGYGLPNFTNIDLSNTSNLNLLLAYIEENKDSNKDCYVYVTQSSNYSVIVPKTIVVDGKNKKGVYVIVCKGNIAGNETLRVLVSNQVVLSQYGKNNIIGNIVQTKKSWTYLDLLNNTNSEGVITIDNMTAGKWNGSFVFDITLKETLMEQ